uniref:SGNH hydrolase-type esterase domain-containing protein n=1 Tax=Magallana gigas TaxID=29159 RepID=A0A8W8IHN0_MAGGI
MPKVKKGQTEGTKGPKNKRKRTEKTRDVGTSSAQAESLSKEVPQMMAPVTLHGNAAPGAPGGLDAAPIPANACLAHQDMALLKGLDNRDLNHSPPPDQLSNSRVEAFSEPCSCSQKRPGSNSSKVSQFDLGSEATRLLNAANAVNTTSTYITGISAFEKFRVLTQSSVTWPPPLDQLLNFIAYLSLNGYSDATARAYISAIGYKCKIEGLRCSVWIVGSSIVRNAGIAALSRPGGQGLGLQTKGIDIWWQGYGGLRFVDLACKLRWLAQFENPPNFIVIHCGANDIGQVKTQKLLDRGSMALLKKRQGDGAVTKRVNRAAAKEILGCGGRLLRHTQFLGNPKQLYSRDGVHLSGLGNDIYLNNLQGALEYFVKNKEGVVFPVN